MARPFCKVRALLKEHDMTQADLARELKLSAVSVSNRMRGAEDWKLSEIWATMNLFGIPANQMHEYFPEDGQNEPDAKRRPMRTRIRRAA